MNFLILGLEKNQQVLRLREEAEKRGHTLYAVNGSKLTYSFSNETGFTFDFRDFENSVNFDISKIDVIYLWALGKRKKDVYFLANYLNRKYNIRIVNKKYIEDLYMCMLSDQPHYLANLDNNLPIPKTHIIHNVNSVKTLGDFIKYPLISKVSGIRGMGSKGKGVFKLNSKEELKDHIREYKDLAERFIIREYIENEGDVRIYCIGYKAIGAMLKKAPEGDFRNNISLGGTGYTFDLNKNPEIKKIAEQAAKSVKTEIAGVDIIIEKGTNKPYILEINSGPQFLGLEEFTDINVAEEIIKYFENSV